VKIKIVNGYSTRVILGQRNFLQCGNVNVTPSGNKHSSFAVRFHEFRTGCSRRHRKSSLSRPCIFVRTNRSALHQTVKQMALCGCGRPIASAPCSSLGSTGSAETRIYRVVLTTDGQRMSEDDQSYDE